jgi:acyl-CoA dehydrogenase
MKRKIFDQDHDRFRDSYRRFIQKEVQPYRDAWQEAGIVPRDMFLKMGEQGYLLAWADEAYGGLGLEDFRYQQIMIEEDATYGDSGFFHTLHSRLVGPYLKHFGDEEQWRRFLPKCISGECILAIAMTEPDAGSDLAGMTTRAVDRGDHWALNGTKSYISNGILADLVVVAAKTDPENPRSIGLFLVERGMEGFVRGRNLDKLGLRSQDTAELFFNDVKVPKTNTLGSPRKGFHYLMRGLAEERLIAAAQYLANAWRAFEITRDFVAERKAFGKRIADFQNTRFQMAALRAELDTAQVYVDRCVEAHVDGELTSETAAMAKLMASEVEWRMVDQGVQFHGGAGYMREYEICRRFADARVSRIYAGSSEIMKEIVARSIFGKGG